VERAWTEQDVDAAVVVEEQTIYSPAPRVNGEPPPECDYIHFLRFRPADGSTLDPADPQRVNPDTTDAMLVMLPGIVEGANGFEYLGRQLVYMAKTFEGKNFEVWAIDRRPNTLEDLYVSNYLEEELDAGRMTVEEAVRVAVDYYYLGKEVNGHTFKGWYTNEDVPFLAEFGLRLATEDVFKVIETMVPDPEVRKEKVFVGGHSLGGIMTSMFAGWDLDGDPATLDDAGFNNCAGLFGFDTIVTPLTDVVYPFLQILPKFLYDQITNMTEGGYVTLVEALRNDPHSDRILPFPMINAETMALLEAIGMMAYYEPDAECTVVREVPYSDSAEMMLRFIHSRDLTTFMDGVPQLTDFRYTNEALLGIVFDDSFVPVGMIQNSMGFLGGGTVVEKSFPKPEFLNAVPLLSDLMSTALGKGPYFIANDAGPSASELGQGPLYYWVNFDEIGDASDPLYQDVNGEVTYTTLENEVSDIHDVARVIFKGPLNLTEWYFSTRLLADIMAALFPYGKKYGLNFLHADRVPELPKVEFLAEQGVLSGPLYEFFIPGEYEYIKGYNHLDVLTACANAPSRRENEVIKPLIRFVLENLDSGS
jgi:pimeloyl-ACP methyl ester carboxylesterase